MQSHPQGDPHHPDPQPPASPVVKPSATKQNRTLLISFIIITGFMLIEAIGGWLTHSLALLSDAGHMLSDAAALGATLLAFKIGEKSATEHKTFGYKRFEILVAGVNGATLVIIAAMIFIEAVGRFSSPPDIATKGMLAIATVGMLINLLVAWLLHRGGADHIHTGHDHDHDHDHDHKNTNSSPKPAKNLNLHSAYLHVLGDLLGSVAAIIAALAMMGFGWWWADPLASVIVAVLILISGLRVVKQSVHILMEGTPSDVSLDQVAATITAHSAVLTVHDLHVWSITSGLHALSCHIVVDGDMSISKASDIIQELEIQLRHLGISHTTIQVENHNNAHIHGDTLVCNMPKLTQSSTTHIGHHH